MPIIHDMIFEKNPFNLLKFNFLQVILFPLVFFDLSVGAHVVAENSFSGVSSGKGLVNEAPVAGNDETVTLEDQQVIFSVVANDSDPDGSLVAATIDLDVSTSGVQKSFSLVGDGDFSVDDAGNLTFVPAPHFFGTTRPVFYTIQDDTGVTSNVASVIVTVKPVNDAPVFEKGSDLRICAESGAQTFMSWAGQIAAGPQNESDQQISFVVTGNSNPALFLVPPTVSESGTLSYTPDELASGTALITLVLKDDGGVADGGENVSSEASFSITVVSLTVFGEVSALTCFGSVDGTIALTVNGGTPPYRFLWNDGSTLQNRSELNTGSYTVTVTDSEGCNRVADFVIGGPLPLEGTIVKTDATCFGGTDGSIEVSSFSGGSGTYEFSVDGGENWQAGNHFSNLAAGIFPVYIRDAGNPSCIKILGEITIGQPERLLVNSRVTPCSCIGASDGAIDLIVTGGKEPYRYQWSNGSATSDLTGISSGRYQVTVTDDSDCEASGTLDFRVDAKNNVPVAYDKVFQVDEDSRLLVNLSVDDQASCDGGNVWALHGANGGAKNGMAKIFQGGSLEYFPNPNYFGSDEISYSLCDINGDCSMARILLTVRSVNDFPVANNDVFVSDEDIPIFGETVVKNDVLSGDGGNTWSLVGPNGGAVNGRVTLRPDGTFDYVPAPDFNGSDYFMYKICDQDDDCEAALVTVILNPVGDIPYANDDVIFTPEEVPVEQASVAANDLVSGDGGNSWSLFGINGGAQHGKVTMSSDGTYSYVPDVDYSGSDSFIYFICDNENDCTAAIVSITVLPVNDPPTAKDDIGVTLRGYSMQGNLLTNDRDQDGDILMIDTIPVRNPEHGRVIISPDGRYTYIPNAGYSGADNFVYQVCDNGTISLCSQANVTLAIADFAAGNNEPVAVADNFQGSQGLTVTGNVLANDFDVDGNLNTSSVTVLGPDPSRGNFTLLPNGKFTFTPNPDFTGKVNFQYRVCDTGSPGLCAIATATIEILTNPAKNSTFATDDCFMGLKDVPITGNVLSNDIDQQGDVQQINLIPVIAPGHGIVTLNPNGTFRYVPQAKFNGHDWFVYEVCDNNSPVACSRATVHLLIGRSNRPPLAEADTMITSVNVPVAGVVLVNDTDPNGDSLSVRLSSTVVASNGTVTFQPDGSFTYTPDPGFSGTDRFGYVVCDDGQPALCSEAVVTLEVLAANKLPVAVADAVQTIEDSLLSGNVAINDILGDGANVWTTISLPENGVLTLTSSGAFEYVPNGDFNGTDSFVYSVCDSDGDCSSALVSIMVNPVDDLPVARDDQFELFLDGVLQGDVSENDAASGDGGNRWIVVQQPASGSLNLHQDGTFTYSPNPDFAGTDRFVYRLCDGDGDCTDATAIIDTEDIVLPNQVFTPNGDGKNDRFIIKGIEHYPDNNLTVFNRWGSVVYSKSSYQNEWDGQSNKKTVGESSLPVGTYFYVLDYGRGRHKTGYVYIDR